MGNLLDNLKTLLQKDERLVSEGELLKNKIIELALKLDKDLIRLLLSDKKMKEVFFACPVGSRSDSFGADGNIKANFIIKGNNLLALHSLKKRFAGRVKLIYIDPTCQLQRD